MYMMGMDLSYLLLIVLTLVIGMAASGYVNHMLNKYRQVPMSAGLTGAEVAARMLSYHGVAGVKIRQGGNDQDFFDPRTNVVTLSPPAYSGHSITAMATACHEVGHACQYAQGYTPMRIRGAIVPVANVASYLWIFVLIIGIFLVVEQLIIAAIVLYAAVVVFQLVTLPVEFNASHRAMDYMQSIGLPDSERRASFSVLRACALTYVASALTSILQLLWLLGRARR